MASLHSSDPPRSWRVGDYLTHRSNPELGIGRIQEITGRALVVAFTHAGSTLRVAANTDALLAVDLSPGRPVRVTTSGERAVIIGVQQDGSLELGNGRVVAAHEVWPLQLEGALIDRLAAGDLDALPDFALRLDILHLLARREAGGYGSFLGGRVRLYPHQLYVAERATASDPVRWLLADEVGLGKTIEAALILNHLVHTRGVERVLVVAPESLTVQWLGELWRKYHQVFTLLDNARLADVARDFGADFNPFELHRRAVVALETLIARPELTTQAVLAGVELLVVDEAQRLRRPPDHPGEPAWRAVAPIAARGRHVLLLSATPLEDDAHGFFRLLQLLRPDEFPEGMSVEARLALGTPLPACTSSTRRSDIGGLPPRVAIPIALDGPGTRNREVLENAARAAPVPHAVARRQKLERIRRALASGAALHAALAGSPDAGDQELAQRARTADATDPRVEWLAGRARRWRDAREKTLVFVAHRETLEMLRTMLSERVHLATATFHEDLPSARRDLEVARFRAADGPSLLISTECGGEGRNFEFCRRLVLFDLPWSPSVVEQRIGRLDRIGRQVPVEIVYFRPGRGVGLDVARVYEALGLFREPLAGLEPQLAHIEGAIEEIALEPGATLSDERLGALVLEAEAARTRIREAAYQQLHRQPYRQDMAGGILARVPRDLDALTQDVVITGCARLGFSIERPRGRRTFAIELGQDSLVDGLPGVPGGSAFVGSFDREEAVEDETIDFFASGHRLVESLLAYYEESPDGRVARIALESGGEGGAGLIALYKEGPSFEVVALDSDGRPRPDWAALLRARPLRLTHVPDTGGLDAAAIRRLGYRLDGRRRPYALAALLVQQRDARR